MSRALNRVERLNEMEQLYQLRAYSDLEMAEQLGVDRSTVNRDRRLLETQLPFVIDPPGAYRIDRMRYLSSIRLNLVEALTLYLAARRASQQMQSARGHVAKALGKLALCLRQPMTEKLVQTAQEVLARTVRPERAQVVETLARAWAERIKVRIAYRSMSSDSLRNTVISPYLIEPSLWSDSVYVIGHSDFHNELRTFKVERIEQAMLDSVSFTIPADFDEAKLLRFAWGVWFSERAPELVVLRFAPGVAARRLKESTWHPQERVEDLPDGGCLWQAPVAEWREMLPWIRGWGAEVEVLAPEGLRQAIREELYRSVALYTAS
jgi:CRISPR-associated endonuclease/helicase Cas3